MKIQKSAPWLGPLGSILAVLAPKGLCPICVAASGGILSSVGLGFIAVDSVIRWLLPATLMVGLVGLWIAARRRRRWRTLVLGVMGAVVLYGGWLVSMRPVMYGGMALLVLTASLLNINRQRGEAPLVQIGTRKESHGET